MIPISFYFCLCASVSLWLILFLQNFTTGLDNFLDSVEDLRLNKSEISQASVSFFK